MFDGAWADRSSGRIEDKISEWREVTGEGERDGDSTGAGMTREEARCGTGCSSGGSAGVGSVGGSTCIGDIGSCSFDVRGSGGDRERRGRNWDNGAEDNLIASSFTSSCAYASKIKVSALYDSGRRRCVSSRLSLLSKRLRRVGSASLSSLAEKSLEERGSGTCGGVSRFDPAPRRVALKR